MAIIIHRKRDSEEIVSIQDDSDNSYYDTVANFEVDNGAAFPTLPNDDIGREYQPGKIHFTKDADQQRTNKDDPWVVGDGILSNLATIVAAKATRVNPPVSLADYKTMAKGLIDVTAGKARQRYITAAPGQDAVYLMKYDEAKAYKDAGYPTIGGPDEYPHLTAEATSTSQTEQQVADLVIATRDAWVTLSASIEGERIGGKQDVDAGVDEAEVDASSTATIIALDAI